MMRILIALCLTMMISTAVMASQDSVRGTVFGLYFTFSNEVWFANLDALNKELERFDYAEAKLSYFNTGFGGRLQINRFMLSYSVNGRTRSEDTNVYFHEMEYRANSFNLGYDMIGQPGFSLYPFAGFKWTYINYLYSEKPQGQINFEDFISNGRMHQEFTNRNTHLDVGLGFSRNGALLLGLRGGYLVPLRAMRWTAYDGSVVLRNGPEIDYNFYVTLTVGLGSTDRTNRGRMRSIRI